MEKLQNENGTDHSGTILTDRDGTQYFLMGKVRIKVSEHFAQDGKPLDGYSLKLCKCIPYRFFTVDKTIFALGWDEKKKSV